MKPAAFKYLAPESLTQVFTYFAEYGDDCKLLAGGQSLIPAMNFRLAEPAVLIDLHNISNLSFIRTGVDNELQLGAMTTQAETGANPNVQALAPLLHETIPFIAHPQIRNRGTIGGSIVHADPAAELPAVMTVIGGRFHLQSQRGERCVNAVDFFTGMFETVLEPDEILASIEIPAIQPRTGWSFKEVSRRHGDYAMVGIAVMLTLDEHHCCNKAEIAFLSVGDGPVQAVYAARLLQGKRYSEELCAAAAEKAAIEDIDPGGDIHASAKYRRHLAHGLTQQALSEAFKRALSSH